MINTVSNKYLKNIDNASWLKTMEHYPQNVPQMKLLVSIVDRIGIFDKFNLDLTADMDYSKLNILYAILRITNKLFSGYLDYVVKKVFRDGLQEIFPCTDLAAHDLLLDQLTQDLDHFVCQIIKNHYPQLKHKTINNEFVIYLESNFKKTFYRNIMKKLDCCIDANFFENHDNLFSTIIQEFIKYTHETLNDTYETMKIFCDQIFDPNCKQSTINKIIDSIKKHINLQSLLEENCVEIDVYSEQKLDDDSTSAKKTHKHTKLQKNASAMAV